MLSYNDSISICAQQENPFVENKPYNPDHVLAYVITHLLDGLAPQIGDNVAADHLKRLYITTIQVLHEKEMPINEASIVQMRQLILERIHNISPVKTATTLPQASIATPAPCYVTDLTNAVRYDIAGKRLTVKRLWIQWSVLILISLLLIKIFK